MGVYNYLLTTKTRRFKEPGAKKSEEFHLIRYSDKQSFGGPSPLQLARAAKVENAWGRRNDWPKYAVHEDDERGLFKDHPVYGGMCIAYFSEGYVDTCELLGYLRVIDDKTVFEKWDVMYASLPSAPNSAAIYQTKWDVEKALRESGVIKGDFSVRRMSHRDGHPHDMRHDNLSLSFQHSDDLVRAKLVLAGLGAQEYTKEQLSS